jgi:hypothetical protein
MLTAHRPAILASLVAIALTLVASAVSVARGATANRSDTITNVATAGRAGIGRIQQTQSAMGDAANVMARMSSDTTFQKAVLGYANKNDVAGLSAFLQKVATHSTVTVKTLADFRLEAEFSPISGYSVHICVSSVKDCSNENAYISFGSLF